MTTDWFHYHVRVQPHHTDYAGVVWHGAYVAWMEAARVDCLRSHGTDFADWVAAGVDLPVVDLWLRYRQSLSLGAPVLVKTRLAPRQGVRLVWHYEICHGQTGDTCVLAQVTLVPVAMDNRRILRRLPPSLESVITEISAAAGHRKSGVCHPP
ncbi:Putative esterase [Halomicronema hongdechloris C2206]|uniref:Esterase n=1 Tax=Halomicronema hongdechloris C2206 TaxID=1641165 RepID=A0A1Z3HUT5_9CYAN|nr:thioesterase family protein [Halomicronema hongdechloris]ASC74081.1 Putative esterase [Halomicronema hongdechloris C2206]